MKDVLLTLTFRNLGIFKLIQNKAEAGAETVRRLKVEMYCHDIRFAFNPAYVYGNI